MLPKALSFETRDPKDTLGLANVASFRIGRKGSAYSSQAMKQPASSEPEAGQYEMTLHGSLYT